MISQQRNKFDAPLLKSSKQKVSHLTVEKIEVFLGVLTKRRIHAKLFDIKFCQNRLPSTIFTWLTYPQFVSLLKKVCYIFKMSIIFSKITVNDIDTSTVHY